MVQFSMRLGRKIKIPKAKGAGITGIAMIVYKFGLVPSKTKLALVNNPRSAIRRTRVELVGPSSVRLFMPLR